MGDLIESPFLDHDMGGDEDQALHRITRSCIDQGDGCAIGMPDQDRWLADQVIDKPRQDLKSFSMHETGASRPNQWI